jgi:radical SAM protein with 4Fe4S-binding SPASM domain
MEWGTMEKLIDQMVAHYEPGHQANLGSHFNINFFGGEPFLNWEVMKNTFEYVEGLRKKGIVFSIYILSNGTVWNEDIHEFLGRYKASMGHRLKLQISVDGCEESHNQSRPMIGGQDSFKLIAGNIKKFRSIIPDIQVRETLLPSRVDKFYDDYVALSDMADVVQMTPIIEEDWNPVLDKAKEQLEKIYKLFFEQLKTTPVKFLSLLNSPLIEANERRVGCYSPGDYKGCHAGDQMVGVTVDGEIYPCHRFIAYRKHFDYKLGDVQSWVDPNNDKLKEIKAVHFSNKDCMKCTSYTCVRCFATNKYLEGKAAAKPTTGYCEFCRMNQEFVNKYSDRLFEECNNTLSAFSVYKSPTSKRRGIVMSKGAKVLGVDAEDLMIQGMNVLLKTLTEIRHQNEIIIPLLKKIAEITVSKEEKESTSK